MEAWHELFERRRVEGVSTRPPSLPELHSGEEGAGLTPIRRRVRCAPWDRGRRLLFASYERHRLTALGRAALALSAYVVIVVLRGIGRRLTRFGSAALALSLVFLGQWLGVVIALNIWGA
jgi:fructose-1,6-bisphosphatase/inositol monophosphatase family enzyme